MDPSHHPSEQPTSSVNDRLSGDDSFNDDEVIISPRSENHIWRKIDARILPVASILYLLSWLDRTNVGNARVAGLQDDLKLTPMQYSTALTVTFVPYVLVEIPSNLFLKVAGPNLLLPTLVICWGVVSTLQGIVHNYAGFLICRFFLGLFEGELLPDLTLYLSGFYPCGFFQLHQPRLSTVTASATLSGTFSGLLATAISNMQNAGRHPAWAWIFILEGLFMVAFGFFSFWMLPSSPATARFLSQWEKDYVMEYLRNSRTSDSGDDDLFRWHEVGESFKLLHMWLMMVLAFLIRTITFALGNFTPSLVHALGYSPIHTQLMTVPPYTVAFIVTLTIAYISDKYHSWGLTLLFSSFCSIVGFSIFLSETRSTLLYSSLFLTIMGASIITLAIQTWMANNATPHICRATGISAMNMMANSGSILLTWLFGTLSIPPRYTMAITVSLIFLALVTLLMVLTILYLWDQNNRKARRRANSGREDEPKGLGDSSTWFAYIL
ncbi:hypothetical protein AN958_00388 [Leucoagaricus sp. SymC.cos]|nr:hypothetical protein AN958_00388 [Leucoagaricus sp. SymC.cos]